MSTVAYRDLIFDYALYPRTEVDQDRVKHLVSAKQEALNA